MSFSLGMPFHEGEEKMHRLLRVPPQDNPTSTMLTPQASNMFQRAPLLAFGTLDAQSRPWTTLWGGEPGFSEPLGGGFVGTRTLVDGKNDPVVQALIESAKEDGQMAKPPDGGKLVAGLAIDLMTRKRVKTAGHMVASTLRDVEDDTDASPAQQQLQLITKISQSLGNCPKYLNQYEIHPAPLSTSSLQSKGRSLTPSAKSLISRADMFFLSTSTPSDMDVNHRGGPPGFVRLLSASSLIYPEYSGNRLYQSLGNLLLNPKIGITFPDYRTGDVLYLTGRAEILAGQDAAAVLPGSNLAVKVEIGEARYVVGGLGFRGERKGMSMYNPGVRTAASEGNVRAGLASTTTTITAHLTKTTPLTPSITRFTFSLPSNSGFSYKPSQWVALDFSKELDSGYEHMRDADPLSLNDDFVRTFTLSSTPSLKANEVAEEGKEKEREFEITIRKVGTVTSFLHRQNASSGLHVLVRGVGGGMSIPPGTNTAMIAAGVGITPLLGQLTLLPLNTSSLFKLFWAVRSEDVGLVRDSFRRYPGLAGRTVLFLTGPAVEGVVKEDFRGKGARVDERRMRRGDVEGVRADEWFVCAGKGMRGEVVGWLEGRRVVCEDFDY
ncbi:Riboflavin synthase-like beta-barrel [Pyrenophora seminiperda CCB06]|uniref:Riboflavin synthase-like beta-barrel n=1 Tax=Pyrenophora seminiperda CCB06 TaxID=1302712 RepID=A0A3M7M1M1_9PLEO|nr:Riboflavin synthase-like beta-barrel [Pyrenophora seminiperda CCB06]